MTNVGKKDLVVIHPTGPIAILRKSDYDLLYTRARQAQGLRGDVRELRNKNRELMEAIGNIHELAMEALRTGEEGSMHQIEADLRAALEGK